MIMIATRSPSPSRLNIHDSKYSQTLKYTLWHLSEVKTVVARQRTRKGCGDKEKTKERRKKETEKGRRQKGRTQKRKDTKKQQGNKQQQQQTDADDPSGDLAIK